VYEGAQVGVHYDPLLAKISVYAEHRPAAMYRMYTALHDTVVLGVHTNRDLLLEVLKHPVFQGGQASTAFIDEHFSGGGREEAEAPLEALIAAALLEMHAGGSGHSPNGSPAAADPYSPWARPSGFRLGAG